MKNCKQVQVSSGHSKLVESKNKVQLDGPDNR